MQGWRKKHPLSEEARAKKNAATYVCMAVKRGKMEWKSCQVCGCLKSVGRVLDVAKPTEIFWSCKACNESMKVN